MQDKIQYKMGPSLHKTKVYTLYTGKYRKKQKLSSFYSNYTVGDKGQGGVDNTKNYFAVTL